jgi:outer membrane protein assembly factor BamB
VHRAPALSGLSTPAVAEGLVVVGAGDGSLLALSADTGRLHWSHRTDMPLIPGVPDSPRDSGPLHSSPLIAEGVAYVCDGRLLAIDLATGEPRWRSSVLAAKTSSPAMAGGLIYAAELGAVCAVEPDSGRLCWRTEIADAHLMWSTPAVAGGSVLVCAREQVPGAYPLGFRLGGGVVTALDAASGALQWRVRASGRVASAAAVHAGVAYVTVAGTRPHILALDVANGEVRGQQALPAPMPATDLVSSVAHVGGIVCVGLLSAGVSCYPADLRRPARRPGRRWFRRG